MATTLRPTHAAEAVAPDERRGLSHAEAARRLAANGPNEIPADTSMSVLRLVADVMREPMFLLLVAAAALYLALGDLAEGLLITAFAGLTIVLVILQRNRSEKALAALQAISAPTARVMREGTETRIAARDLVIGDRLLIGEGERIGADAVLRTVEGMNVDESLLTGEAVPVRKTSVPGAFDHGALDPGGDDQPVVYSGTLVVSGHGEAEVVATGRTTRAGHIGVSLATIESDDTVLERAVGRLVRAFGVLAIVVSGALVIFYGLTRNDWLQGALSGIALAMAMLPEEFPVVMAVFLALGALRLARIDVLVRRSSAIEALGAATVLCVDKTGTLTSNRMQVRALVSSTGETDLEHAGRAGAVRLREEAAHVLDVARRASRRTSVDPLDRALQETATALIDAPAIAEDPVREYGLTQDLLAVTLVWRDPDGTLRVAAKGAPEAIIGMCRLAPSEIDAIEVALARLAERGWRVLAIAEARFNGDRLPDRPDQFDFSYTGLVAFEDPLRPTVAAAVREARAAGVTVAMITGDYPATARAVALQAGIDSKAAILTGPEIARMDAAGLRQAVSRTQIFARIQPVQKLKIVEAFAANGQIVAMTGDGVNDAPALKAAHIGIAIGPRGTDVAREASDLVLLKEDFGLIVAAIRMGRRIFDNLRKVMIYITAIHVPIAGLALLPVLFGFPPLMLPVHVVLTEMIIDPVCSLAFEGEKEEANVMNRPPRAADEPIAGPAQIGLGLLQGVMLLGATLFTAWAALQLGGQTEGQSRALAFMALSAGNLLLVRVNATHQMTLPRLFDSNHRMYWAIVLLAVAALTVAVTVPVIMKVLQFEQPSLGAICLAILAGSVAVLAFDLLKRMPGVQRALGARAYMVG